MSMSGTPPPTPEIGPIYFFRETEPSFGFLSQWYDSKFTAPNPSSVVSKEFMVFLTTEQYMMYRKAIVFQDNETAEQIMQESQPRRHKSLGRNVKNFDTGQWNKCKEEVVEEGNWWKFTRTERDEDLKKRLLETGNRLLVEASPFDRIWGIGYKAADAERNKSNWGENLLGKSLMRVRDRLRAEEQARERA